MKFVIRTALAVSLLLPLAHTASADEPAADDVIKYREALMEIIGGHTASFFAILQGKVPHQDSLAYHASALADASALVKSAFEQNTAGQGDAKTEAKDKIWDEWDDFAKKIADLEAASEALAEAAASGDMAQIGPAAGPLGAACKGCHEAYRED